MRFETNNFIFEVDPDDEKDKRKTRRVDTIFARTSHFVLKEVEMVAHNVEVRRTIKWASVILIMVGLITGLISSYYTSKPGTTVASTGAAYATRIYTTGFERNSVAANAEITGTSGTAPTVSTTTVRSGTYSMRTNASAATSISYWDYGTADTGTARAIARAYIRVATMPSAETQVLAFYDGTALGTTQASIRMNNAGDLKVYNEEDGTQVGSTLSAAVTTGIWYRLELKYDFGTAATADTAIAGMIDGNVFASSIAENHANGTRRIGWGVITSTTGDFYWDDIGLNNDAAATVDNWVGEGKVVLLLPDGENAPATPWDVNGGGTRWQSVDDPPSTGFDDATTYVDCSTSTTSSTNDFSLVSSASAGIGPYDNIRLFEGWSRGRSTSATASAHTITNVGTGTDAGASNSIASASWFTNDDTVPRNSSAISYDDTGAANYGALTPALIDSISIRLTTADCTPEHQVTAVWGLVEYVPVEGGRLWSSGFELQNNPINTEEWDAVAGTINIDTTTKRSGDASARVQSLASGTEESVAKTFAAANDNGPFFFRTYLYITTAPATSSENRFFEYKNSGGTVLSYLTLTDTRTLKLFDEDGQVGSASSALGTGTWYRVEVKLDATGAGATDTVEGKIDGTNFATSATRDLSTGVTQIFLGGNLNGETQTQGDWYFDDVALNKNLGSSENSYPGGGKIVHLRPNANGDAVAWTNTYTNIDDTDPDEATTVVSTSTVNAIEEAGLFDTSTVGIGGTDTIKFAAPGVRFNTSAAATMAFTVRLKDASAAPIMASPQIVSTGTTWFTNKNATPRPYPMTAYTRPNRYTSWTTTALDNAQIGVQERVDTTSNLQVTAMWLLVEFEPAAAPTITVSGGCFTDAGEGTPCGDAGAEEIKVAVNGVLQAGSDGAVDGAWTFTVDQPASGATMVFFVNGEGTAAERATTVVKYDGDGGNVTNVKMYQSQLVIGADAGSANGDQTIVNADLDTTTNGYEYSDDTDVVYGIAAGVLTVDEGANLTETLYIISGDTFRPDSAGGDTVTTHHLYFEGTYTTDNNTTNVAGDWTNAGTFTATTGTVAFNGTAAQTIISNGVSFYLVTFSNSSASDPNINYTGAMTVGNNMTLSNTTRIAHTNNTNFSVTGTINSADATDRILTIASGTADISISGAIGVTNDFASLTITGNDITLANIGAGSAGVVGATSMTSTDAGDTGILTLGGTVYNANAATYVGGATGGISITGAAAAFTSTADNITFTNTATLGNIGSISVTTAGSAPASGDITFGTIRGTSDEDITLNASSANTTVGLIGDETANEINTVAITGATNTLNGNIFTSDAAGNTVTITGAAALGAGVTIDTDETTNDGNVSFTSTINSSSATDRAFTIAAGGADISISGAIGATNDLASLTITGNDITLANIGAGSAGVVGATSLTGTTGGDAATLTFTGTIYNANQQTYAASAGDNFAINGGAATTFTSSNDAIAFNTANILLANGSDLTVTSGGGAITTLAINGNSSEDVTITSTGGATNTISVGAIGTSVADGINTVALSATASVTLNGNITTSNAAGNTVTITGPAFLGANVTVTTDTAGTDGIINFTSTVDSTGGARTFTIAAGGGDATISGATGNSSALSSLTINANDISIANVGGVGAGVSGATSITGDATGTITLTGTAYNTTGTQAYNAGGATRTITLNEAATFTTANTTITFTGTVDSQTAETNAVTLAAGTAQVTFNNSVGSTQSLGLLTKQGSGDVLFGSNSLTATGLTLSAGTINNAATDSGIWTISGNVTISAGTLKSTTSTLYVGGSWSNSGTFDANGGTVNFNATATGKTVEAGSSSFYSVVFNSSTGGWTIQTNNLTATNNFAILDTAASGFTLQSGRTLEVQGTYSIVDAEKANTTWTGSTLYLNSGTAYTIGAQSDTTAETYDTLQIGANTDIRTWLSTATTFTVNATGSLYSQDHANVNGELYIWGDYNVPSGTTDYWNYADDFDGTASANRQVDVRIDDAAKVTVGAGEVLEIVGTSGNRTTVSRQASNGYELVCDGGTIDIQYTDFDYLDGPAGLDIKASSSVTELANNTFENLVGTGGTDANITVVTTVIGLGNRTFSGNSFTLGAGDKNVARTGSDDTETWDFDTTNGEADDWNNTASANEADPGMLVWNDSVTNLAPDTPTNLGPAGYIDASGWMNDSTPTFNFDITDPDLGDLVRYRIQIDDSSDFSSLIVDYKPSSYGAEGTYNYTVGQAGTYTVGSESMTLSDAAGYYWKVQAEDDDTATSAWEEAGADATIDFRLDATAPTGGSVVDGTDASDDNVNDGSLNTLSAYWTTTEPDFNVSGKPTTSVYEYAVGTTAGGTDIKTWTATGGTGTATTVTDSALTLQTSKTYYITIRATDKAGNTMTFSANGVVANPTISFSMSASSITFADLNDSNSWTDDENHTVTTSTNGYAGYVVRAFESIPLTNVAYSKTIIDLACTWIAPCAWGANLGFGYTSSDTSVQGSNRFNNGNDYAAFSQSSPGNVVADNPGPVTGSPITNESFTITYKVKVDGTQTAAKYQNVITYIVVPTF